MRALTVGAVVGLLGFLPVTSIYAQTATPTRGRIDRTVNVQEFSDFTFYLPDEADTISVYVQWSNNAVVVVDDVSLLCLRGQDGIYGNEDDDVTFNSSRQTSYEIERGRLWYTTTTRSQRCWLTLDFQHYEQYDRSARARFTIILSERDTTEGTWEVASSADLQQFNMKRQRLHAPGS